MYKLQILLRDGWRHDEGVRLVQDHLRTLGFTPTAAGLVTVSADSTPEAFHKVFGPEASPQTDRLPVPSALAQYVDSIAVAPPHVRMDSEKDEKE
jgi:hypothetical protein